jgi:hypothetical protein
MAFKHHYHEVLDTIGDMFTQIFRGLRDRYQVGSSIFKKIQIFLNFLNLSPMTKFVFRKIKTAIFFLSFEYGYFSPLLC